MVGGYQALRHCCLSAMYTKDVLVTGATLINWGETLKLTEFKFPDRIVNLHDWTRHLHQR